MRFVGASVWMSADAAGALVVVLDVRSAEGRLGHS